MPIVFESRDGSTTVLSEKFGVTYHSKYGAVQESRHVYIKEGLFAKCIAKKELSILEMGFGTGLNALMTCLEAEKLELKINYTAIEKYPIPNEIVGQLNFMKILEVEGRDDLLCRMHRAEWEKQVEISDFFSLKKLEQAVEDIAFQQGFDLVYFDAFTPNVQPELWELPMLTKMYDALLPTGILVTYCAKGSFKRALKEIGFKVETLKGPPGKREMTRAVKP
ncbi:MAG TPA: SAM-dependent methyltransferase [Bacteroidetes bacterium]|nr:SAM-dependent methyltransferase [Bacteroidota bacterium]